MQWNPDEGYWGRWFKKFNRKYFDNQLPKETLVIWRKPFVSGHGAEFVPFPDGRLLILINPVFKKIGAENKSLLSLLHEMCHLSLWTQNKNGWGKHGKVFQKEMLRIANLGAFATIW